MESKGSKLYYDDDILPESLKEANPDGNAKLHIDTIINMLVALKEKAETAKAEGRTRPEDIDWNHLAYYTGIIHDNVLSMKAYMEQKQQGHKSK